MICYILRLIKMLWELCAISRFWTYLICEAGEGLWGGAASEGFV